MKSLPIPHTDMMLIQTEIDVMSLNNKHKKLDINDIMRRLNTLSKMIKLATLRNLFTN